MKIIVIGGTGLIGKQVVSKLLQEGHDALPASPSLGTNTLTGEGLSEALEGADVVVDVTNSPSFEDQAVLDFFTTSTRNLLAAATRAGIGHYVALSVVGAERLPGSGYMRAKIAQERLIEASSVPFTIVRATQFFEFIGAIVEGSAGGGQIRISTAKLQPVAAEDVAQAVADIAIQRPANGMIEVAGPDKIPLHELAACHLAAGNDRREVIGDPAAPYFGAVLDGRSLTAGEDARLGAASYAQWLDLKVFA